MEGGLPILDRKFLMAGYGPHFLIGIRRWDCCLNILVMQWFRGMAWGHWEEVILLLGCLGSPSSDKRRAARDMGFSLNQFVDLMQRHSELNEWILVWIGQRHIKLLGRKIFFFSFSITSSSRAKPKWCFFLGFGFYPNQVLFWVWSEG